MPAKLERCVTDFMMNEANIKKWPNAKVRRQKAYAICTASVMKKGGEMPNTFSYILDVSALEFAEGDSGAWIHMLPLGTYQHQLYGEMEITHKRVNNFAANINRKVRGIDPDVDYEHKRGPQGGKAAGWIMRAEARPDGLWGFVEWTDDARKAIKKKEYRYFSPEFADKWCDPKTGDCYDDVLAGGALTNRPFLKDLVPINLSEFFALPDGLFPKSDANYRPATSSTRRCLNCAFYREGNCLAVEGEIEQDYISDYFVPINNLMPMFDETEGGEQMEEFLKKLRETLGIGDDADEAKILSEATALKEKAETPTPDPEPEPDAEPTEDEDKGDGDGDGTTEAKSFEEMFPNESKKLADLEFSNRLHVVNKTIDGWKDKGLAPATFDGIRDYRMTLNDKQGKQFDDVVGSILEAGIVTLDEHGSSREVEIDATAKFASKVKELQDKNEKMAFSEAARQVAAENPDLAQDWLDSKGQTG